jgi:hypothetical protein
MGCDKGQEDSGPEDEAYGFRKTLERYCSVHDQETARQGKGGEKGRSENAEGRIPNDIEYEDQEYRRQTVNDLVAVSSYIAYGSADKSDFETDELGPEPLPFENLLPQFDIQVPRKVAAFWWSSPNPFGWLHRSS